MEIKEAIGRIKEHTEIHFVKEPRAIYITEALYMGIDALEKQIPKKPDTKITNRGIGVSGEYDIDSDYICPICKCVVGECEIEEHWFEYCPNCGQALDWSDSE